MAKFTIENCVIGATGTMLKRNLHLKKDGS